MIGFLTLQFMQDTRMFFSLVKAGKFDEAVDYYSHSFVGGSTYGIGHLKVIIFLSTLTFVDQFP